MTSPGEIVLVLGGAGFIGSRTVAALITAGRRVRVLDVARPDDLDPGIDWWTGSVFDRDLLRRALTGVEQVVDLSGGGKPGMNVGTLSGEIATSLALSVETAEICKAAGIRRYVFPSSGGTVYGRSHARILTEDAECRPINAYGVTKLACEHYMRLLDSPEFRVVILRVANPFGEGQRPAHGQGFIGAVFDAALKEESLEIWGDGSAIRDFVYIGDVADGFLRALDYDGAGTLFNIGSGHGRDLNSVIAAILEETGLKVKIELRPQRKVDIESNVLDITRARADLGWSPGTDFRTGLRLTAQWWSRRG